MSLDNNGAASVNDMLYVAEHSYGNCLSGLVRHMMYWIERISSHTQLDDIYPVGSIYMSTVSTNPGTLFGGTWQRIYRRFLVAAASAPEGSTSDNFAPGRTGGNEYVTLTSANLPRHRHAIGSNAKIKDADGINGDTKYYITGASTYGSGVTPEGSYTDYAGDATPEEIETLPPYLAVYMWKRVS